MAKQWSEVIQNPEFKALPPEKQEEARQQYWNTVVAPNVPEHLQEKVRANFDKDTSFSMEKEAVSEPQELPSGFLNSEAITPSKLKDKFPGLPDNFDYQGLSDELQEGYKPIPNVLGKFGEQIGSGIKPSITSFLNTFDLSGTVDYSKEAGAGVRSLYSMVDTDEERERFLNDHFGEGNHRRDPGGRVIIKDSSTGAEYPLDSPETTMNDFADIANEYPKIAGAVAATIATSGASMGVSLLADLAGYMAGFAVTEGAESAIGQNMESATHIMGRAKDEATFAVAANLIGRASSSLVSRIKSPLAGGITLDARQVIADLGTFNADRASRGLPPINLRPSAVNEAPLLVRAEGILSKVPGSAGVFLKKRRELEAALDDEIKFLTRDMVGKDREQVGSFLKVRLIQAIEAKINKARSANNARFTGVTTKQGSEALENGAQYALDTFRNESSKRMASIETLAGTEPIVSTKFIKVIARKLIKGKKGADPFIEGISLEKLEKVLEYDRYLPLSVAQNIRSALGEAISGRAPIAGISEAEAKALYGGMSKGMTSYSNLVNSAKLTPAEARRFVTEMKDFNDFYAKGHGVFNNKGAPMHRILTSTNPEELADYFFRKNNSTNITTIKNTIPEKDFAKFQDASLDYLMIGKTGKQLNQSMDGIGMDVLEATFGKAKAKSLYKFSKAARAVEETSLATFTAERKEGVEILNNLIKRGSPKTAMRARELLGKDSKEWKNVQIAFAERLINNSFNQEGHFVGSKLLSSIHSRYGEATVKKVFEGTGLYENITRIAHISKASAKAEGSAAGGLAAGFYIIGLLSGKLISTATMGTVTWVTAKALSSPRAVQWFTAEPLSQMSRATIRAATESMAYVANKQLAEEAEEDSFEYKPKSPLKKPTKATIKDELTKTLKKSSSFTEKQKNSILNAKGLKEKISLYRKYGGDESLLIKTVGQHYAEKY